MLIKPILLSNLNVTNRGIDEASLRISTGKKLNKASDDPSAFGRVMVTQSSISRTAVNLNMLEFGMARLDARDQTLSSMQEAVQRFQELATMASSGLYKTSDILPEMQSLEKAMVSLGNTKDASGYLFSGTSGNAPFDQDASNVVSYTGTAQAHTIEVEGVTMSGSIDGSPLLGVFSAMRSVLSSMEAGTPVTTAQVGAVATGNETVLNLRTKGAAEASGAQMVMGSLTKRYDRERDEVDNLEQADWTTEMMNLTEAEKQREAILKVISMHLNQRRLFDYL